MAYHPFQIPVRKMIKIPWKKERAVLRSGGDVGEKLAEPGKGLKWGISLKSLAGTRGCSLILPPSPPSPNAAEPYLVLLDKLLV